MHTSSLLVEEIKVQHDSALQIDTEPLLFVRLVFLYSLYAPHFRFSYFFWRYWSQWTILIYQARQQPHLPVLLAICLSLALPLYFDCKKRCTCPPEGRKALFRFGFSRF